MLLWFVFGSQRLTVCKNAHPWTYDDDPSQVFLGGSKSTTRVHVDLHGKTVCFLCRSFDEADLVAFPLEQDRLPVPFDGFFHLHNALE